MQPDTVHTKHLHVKLITNNGHWKGLLQCDISDMSRICVNSAMCEPYNSMTDTSVLSALEAMCRGHSILL